MTRIQGNTTRRALPAFARPRYRDRYRTENLSPTFNLFQHGRAMLGVYAAVMRAKMRLDEDGTFELPTVVHADDLIRILAMTEEERSRTGIFVSRSRSRRQVAVGLADGQVAFVSWDALPGIATRHDRPRPGHAPLPTSEGRDEPKPMLWSGICFGTLKLANEGMEVVVQCGSSTHYALPVTALIDVAVGVSGTLPVRAPGSVNQRTHTE